MSVGSAWDWTGSVKAASQNNVLVFKMISPDININGATTLGSYQRRVAKNEMIQDLGGALVG
jgi:hypothetical protein